MTARSNTGFLLPLALVGALLLSACGGMAATTTKGAKQPGVGSAPNAVSPNPALTSPGTPGAAIVQYWRLIGVGAVPEAALMYNAGVRSKLSVEALANTLALLRPQVSSLKLTVISAQPAPSGTLVTAHATANDGTVYTYVFDLVRSKAAWTLIYDSLVGTEMTYYATGINANTPSLVRAGAGYAGQYRAALFDNTGRLDRTLGITGGP